MPKFRFSMQHKRSTRVKVVEISEGELCPRCLNRLPPDYLATYRQNVIDKHMQKWVMSNLQLTWEEVKR